MSVATTIAIDPRKLGSAILRDMRKYPQQIDKAVRLSAQRYRRLLVKMSPRDTGQFRNSWRVAKLGFYRLRWTVQNDAPHAGIIEVGARPHPVSEAGIQAIALWAKRKLLRGRQRDYAAKLNSPARLNPKTGKLSGNKNKRAKSAVEAEALDIAHAIAWKLRHKGQKGLYIVRDTLPDATRYLEEELPRQVGKHHRAKEQV